MIDWKYSSLYKTVAESKVTKFNAAHEPSILQEDQLDYSINLMRYCGEKDFSKLEVIRPVFEKAVNTLEYLMEEMCIIYLFERIVR